MSANPKTTSPSTSTALSGVPGIDKPLPTGSAWMPRLRNLAPVRAAGACLLGEAEDATTDLSRPARLRRLCGSEFPQLTGDDATAAAHLAMGGAGCISVAANVVPALRAALQAGWVARDFDRVAELRDALAPLHEALFAETDPIPVKAALGLCDGTPRLPLTRTTEGTRVRLARAMATVTPLEEARAHAPTPGATPPGPFPPSVPQAHGRRPVLVGRGAR